MSSSNSMRKTRNWLRSVYLWLMEARYFALSIAVVVCAIFFIVMLGSSERSIRLAGMTLQLLGVGTVIWGVAKTREFFGHTPVASQIKDWLLKFPRYTPKPVVLSASGTFEPLTVRSYGFSSPPKVSPFTTEGRLAAIEVELNQMREQFCKTHQIIDEKVAGINHLIEVETASRNQSVQYVLQRLELTATGGIHITSVGALWLFIGVILGSASPELAAIFSGK